MINWLVRQARTRYLGSKLGAADWKDFIAKINEKKDKFRKEAESICKDNGHLLFPWTCMNSTLCRKCGATVYLHHVHGMTNTDPMSGRALTDKCSVHLDNPDNLHFEGSGTMTYECQDYNGKTVI